MITLAWDAGITNQQLYGEVKRRPDRLLEADNELPLQACTQNHVQAAVVLLQAHVRGWLVRSKYNAICFHTRKMQLLWRAQKSHQNFLVKKQACIKIQLLWRAKKEHQLFLHQKHACLKIQWLWRGHILRQHFLSQKESCLKVQKTWRNVLARKTAHRKQAELLFTIIKIQGIWRMYSARQAFCKRRSAAVLIQSYYRAYIHLTWYRRYKDCLVKVQALIRCRINQRRYLKYRVSARNIQHYFRKWLAQRESSRALDSWKCQMKSARKIQAAWRFFLHKRAAVCIQALYRGWRQRRAYQWEMKQVINLQAIARGTLLRRRLSRQRAAVTTIQRRYRGYSARQNHEKLKVLSAIPAYELHKNEGILFCGSRSISSRNVIRTPGCSIVELEGGIDEILGRLVKVEELRWFFKVKRSVLMLQRWWRCLLQRRSLAATVIQRKFRSCVQRKYFLQKKQSITRIQACWRGCLVRQGQDQIKQQLSELRMRMENTAANADNRMCLENRLTEALAALLSQKTVSSILNTCATIDLATQHSKLCCERLIGAGAITKLLQLIQMTNRSPPHEQVLKHTLSIMANIAYYPEFAKLVAETPGSINIIAEQLLRNKKVLFKAMELLHLICNVPGGLDALRRMPSILRRLHGLTQSLEKKFEVETRSLARLPSTADAALRLSIEKKINETIAQHRALVVLLEKATGEDLQIHLKTIKRMSTGICQIAGSHLTVGRGPFQDRSNQ